MDIMRIFESIEAQSESTLVFLYSYVYSGLNCLHVLKMVAIGFTSTWELLI